MSKYLVTGGCGFIGSQLTSALLSAGHEVIVVDDLSNGSRKIPGAVFVQRDIAKRGALDSLFTDLDGCFHLAAFPAVNIEIEQWFSFHKINLDASLNVFKAAIDAGNIPVVYASTCGVYNDSNHFPLTEDQYLNPSSSYGCDKYSGELNAHFLGHSYQLSSMGLRFFNVYGPYQQPTSPYSGVVTNFITQALDNSPLIIYGDGEQTRDFVFVEDVVNNVIIAMTNLKQGAQVVNICSGQSISINQLADLIGQLLGKECQKEYRPSRPFDAKHSCGSQKKMHAHGFKITHDIKQGLSKTIAYFQSQR